MAAIGFHASHEQAPPSELLAAVRDAEAAGFTRAMCSDHLEPWSVRQGHSGFAWSWLGAALEATALPFGVVTAPGQRYHPAVTAQAAATLAELAPGRFWMALGSGEHMNEHVTGDPWPPKAVRTTRLEECAAVIRALLAGEEVSHDGLVRVDRARVWSLPPEPPALLGAAVTPETAGRAGGWADGLITVNQPPETLRRVLDAFREGGGEGKPAALQVHLSWAPDEEEALRLAHDVRPEDMRDSVLVSADPARHVAWLQELAALGFDELYLHHVGRDQRSFVETFGEEVLPRL
jgi:probable non-F420 flavinoid oxidoreductase